MEDINKIWRILYHTNWKLNLTHTKIELVSVESLEIFSEDFEKIASGVTGIWRNKQFSISLVFT